MKVRLACALCKGAVEYDPAKEDHERANRRLHAAECPWVEGTPGAKTDYFMEHGSPVTSEVIEPKVAD